MTDTKQIKDPIYGYIEIPKEYMDNIIDTPNFQRLRRVIQTSYTPLYSSAVHNRFVHSLGVYYLGQKAAKTLKKELVKSNIVKEKFLENITHTFTLACLLQMSDMRRFLIRAKIFIYRTVNMMRLIKCCCQRLEEAV